MSHQKQASIQDSMSLIQNFLNPIRAQAEKEASMKQAADDSSTSFKDTSAARPEEQAKQQAASTSQTNLGKEQSRLAEENIPTPAPTAKPNSEADQKKPTDDQGTKTLMVDQPTDQFPKEINQAITQEQKVARCTGMGNAILAVLAGVKEASDAGSGSAPNGEAGGSKVKIKGGPGVNDKAMKNPPGSIPNDLDGSPAGGEKTASEAVMEMIDKTAALAAQEYFEGYRAGLIKRAQDEIEVSYAGIDPSILEKVGGVEGLLDKVAMEFPEAVMPEEAMAPEGMEAMPPEMGGDMGGDMGAEGGDSMEAIAAKLDEAGVTPEELQQAMEDVAALQEAGIPPEELANALTQITSEGGMEGGGMEGGGMEPGEEMEEGEGAGEEPGEEMENETPEEEQKEGSSQWTRKVYEILSR